ncbi:holo-ACP synthase [bacterium]|nr:holo-ACP synthase [bacterium]MBU1064561.1 holo-ACP synthase [bacterium]MBU1634417.1 holo-ACP synthase [bacterium]MBU1874632.1 holo-ACP synthase [bacterium]
MIYGIGTDLIEVDRIARQVNGDTRFKEKIFSENEIHYCESFKGNKAQHYAARYAAKEAFFKAIGTGYRGGLAFHEISIENDDLGKPEIVLTGKARDFAIQHAFGKIHVSLSHLKDLASAIVTIEK